MHYKYLLDRKTKLVLSVSQTLTPVSQNGLQNVMTVINVLALITLIINLKYYLQYYLLLCIYTMYYNYIDCVHMCPAVYIIIHNP